MSGPEQSIQERALLANVPGDGSVIGNKTLRELLGWDGDTYWRVRNPLVDAGRLEKGKGKGGSVRLVLDREVTEVTAERVQETAEEAVELYAEEAALYQPMRDVIENAWAKSRGVIPTVVEVTARSKTATGGTWTRPDVVSVAVQVFAHLPNKFIEVITFEIKPSNNIDVLAVYEALAHRRTATHAYVLLHVPPAAESRLSDRIDKVTTAARAYGVGVILAGDPRDYDTWDEREGADRVEPDPGHLDQFISRLDGSDSIREAVRF